MSGSLMKPPESRARRNKDPVPFRTVVAAPSAQPRLQDVMGELCPYGGEPWHEGTLQFWESLANYPVTHGLLEAQWLSLARVMILDHQLMTGQGDAVKTASALKVALARFGIDPQDMLKIRVQVIDTEEAERRNHPFGFGRHRAVESK
jgi:hypothetical protein